MGRKGFVAVFLLLLLTAGSSLAQTGGQGVPGQRRRPGRDEAGRMVDAYVVSNLQESLDLTDEQFVKSAPEREAASRRPAETLRGAPSDAPGHPRGPRLRNGG